MKTKKTLQHIVAVAVVLLTLCLVFAAPISAEELTENSVAYIVSEGETMYYESLEAAVAAVSDSTETTIYLYDADGDSIVTGTGLQIPDGTTGKFIIFDFNGLTYNVTSCVGSSTTLTQGAHFSSGNTVTLKNGTLEISPEAEYTNGLYTYILIQNYADLTLDGITLDGTNLIGPTSGKTYVLSNCMGTVTIQDTTIIAKDGSVAFDVDGAYPGKGGNEVNDNSLSVTIVGDSVIQGAIEITEAAAGREVTLTINGGSFTDPNALNYLGAVEEKEADVTVTLADESVTVGKSITISSGKATLDLNGKKLVATESVTSYLFTIDGENAQLIITDSSEKVGVIETLNGKAVNPLHGIFDFQKGLITDKLEGSDTSVTIYVEGSTSESSVDYTVVNIGEFAKVDSNNYALAVMGSDCSVVAGVNITISGDLKSAAGVCILGSINRDLGTGTYSLKAGVNYPEITVTNTANITSIGSPAIYAAGYGIWTIEDGAELTGNEALSIKTGNFTIYGGTFTANGENTVPPDGNDNGPEKTGAALSITSNDAYPGETKVNVLGGTFSSQKGYAVYEGEAESKCICNNDHVKLFSIQGGNFITNNASLTSPVLFAKMENKQVITGGWFNKVPTLAYLPSGYLPVAKDGGVEVSLSETAVTVVNADSGAVEGAYTKAPAETFSVSEIPAEEGFDFKLYTDSACTTEYMDGMPVYQSMTLYIKWIPHIYYIVFDGNADESLVGTMENLVCEYGKEYQLSALNFSVEGKVFAGWAESNNGEEVKYLGLETVSNLSSENASTVTLYAIWEEVADIEPEEFVEVIIDENGVSTVTNTTDDVMTLDDEDKTVTITNVTSNVQIVILFGEDDELEISDENSVSGNVTNVTVTYPIKIAEIPNLGTINHQVEFVLSNVTSVLPVINATYNKTVADAIHEDIEDDGGVVFAMITAENADAVNDNMTENGVTVTFTIEKEKWTSLMGGEELIISDMQLMISEGLLKGIHLSNGEVKKLTPSVSEEEDNWIITLTGTGFSSYALAFYEPEEGDEQGGGTTIPGTNTGTNTGGSTVKPDTPTEVPPTEDPTDDPTNVPGEDLPDIPDVPVTPEEPSSPAPLLAVLAGLGAAVVLRRK